MQTYNKQSRRDFFAAWGRALVGGVCAAWWGNSARAEGAKRIPDGAVGWKELEAWKNAKRTLVRETDAPLAQRLAEAAQTGAKVKIRYYGGSEWGAEREITPGALFRVDGFGPTYVHAYCHDRQAMRTFVVERMEVGG